jgi:serine phosphatase RsbU (regulator of sigma subunit)
VLRDAAGQPAAGLTERVLAAVLDFQDQHAADDIALLVIQAPPVVAELRPRRSSELVAP